MTKPQWRPVWILKLTLLVGVVAFSACLGPSATSHDGGPALAQVEEVVSAFAALNEGHDVQDGFTSDFASLSEEVAQTYRDSVILKAKFAEDGRGWFVVGTHVRLGDSLGCAFTSGSQPEVSTPGGLVHDGSSAVVCDPPEPPR